MFGFKKKQIKFEDLPEGIQNELEMLEIQAMEGSDPVSVLKRISKKYPGYVPGRLNLASYLLNLNQLAAARSTLEKVSRDYPNEIGAIAGMATVLAAEGEHDQAEQLAIQAIECGYEWPACHGVIAKARENNGDHPAAADAYLNGYRLSPHCWDYLEHYCRLTGRPFTPPTDDTEPCISMGQIESLASFVDEMAHTPDKSGNIPGCDHTLRFAEQWAAQNDIDVIQLYQFLNGHGGFCDCEICLNVTELLIEDECET